MPIYEYACHHCRTIFQFWAQTIAARERSPNCPRCGATDLERLLSSFSALTSRKTDAGSEGHENDGPGGPADANDPFAKMTPQQQAHAEHEMERLMDQAEGLDENDPRQMGHFMERMMQIMGQSEDPKVQEAIRRLKAGEDPDKVEEEMGDVLGMGGGEDDEPGGGGLGGYGYDGGLYDM